MKDKEIIKLVDATSDRTSIELQLGDLKDCSIHVAFSGGASNLVGVLELEATNDLSDTWAVVDGSTQNVTASESHMYNIANANYKYLRVTWVYTSGTGNIQAQGVIKEYPIKGA